jgi:hypothetical protein
MFRLIPTTKDGSGGGYEVEQSLMFENSSLTNDLPGILPNVSPYTLSLWVKRGSLGVSQFIAGLLQFKADNKIGVGGSTSGGTYSDPSAWYHLHLSPGSTSTTSDYFYVNGIGDDGGLYTWSSEFFPGIIGFDPLNGGSPLDGYLSDVHFIDGQSLGPEHFAAEDEDGNWMPIPYTGTYGPNGYYLPFKAGEIGTDSSPNGHDFTVSGITDDSIVADSPTNNWCTFNPNVGAPAVPNHSYGNLKITSGDANQWQLARGTFGASSGKRYWEMELVNAGLDNYNSTGVTEINGGFGSWAGELSTEWFYQSVGNIYNNGSSVIGGAFSQGDIISVAIDMDAGKIWWGRNNTWVLSGNPTTGLNPVYSNLSGTITPASNVRGTNSMWKANYGQRPFTYTPPEGYKSLCTDNLPDVTVNPKEHFKAVKYSGAGSVDTGFKPDLVWVKDRGAANSHHLTDSVRGATKSLQSDNTSAETTDATGLTSFDDLGFTVGSGTGYGAASMVSWNFKAGGDAVANNDGSIPSMVSVNQDMGFSVSTYQASGDSGATIGHGLGVIPSLVILKKTKSNGSDGARGWPVWSSELNVNSFLKLDASSAESASDFFKGTAPTSSLITFRGTSDSSYQEVNYPGDDYLMYAFANTDMVQVGSYTANNSATDNTFVSLPFKPGFLMIKNINVGSQNWAIWDNERDTYNVMTKVLEPNVSRAELNETVNTLVDFYSNGFKPKNSNAQMGGSGKFLYLAIAEEPFKHARGR